MAPRGELVLAVEVGPDEITPEDVLGEFIATMEEWRCRPYVSPGEVPLDEQVILPGPDVLAERASLVARIVRAVTAGRS